MMGMPVTHITMKGKLYVNTLEGGNYGFREELRSWNFFHRRARYLPHMMANLRMEM